jgi:trk system potassium uptake protein TrkA
MFHKNEGIVKKKGIGIFKRIPGEKMQIIVIGCGKVGSSLARELVNNGNEVIIIENDKRLLQNAEDIDCIKINGVPIDKDILKSAGIEQADAVCAVTQDDNMNIMTSQVAKEIFHVEKVVTRIFNPRSKELFEEFGLDTVCSTTLTVDAILRSLEDEKDDGICSVYGTDIVYSEINLEERYIGMQIHEFSNLSGKHVLGLIRKTRFMLALPETKIEKGDLAVFAAIQ